MSALACLLDRRGAPLDRCRLERLGDGLAEYGENASVCCVGPLGIVVRHRTADPTLARHGPVAEERAGLVVAVAGRFGLVDGVSGSAVGDPGKIGCARWALERWASEGPGWLGEVAGSFTLVVAEPARGRLTVVRDHLGDLKVYHRLEPHQLTVATEAGAILGDGSASVSPDDHAVARFLGFRFGHTERSFFRGIRELAPAHLLRVDGAAAEIVPYWRFPQVPSRSTPEDACTAFVGGLERSVRGHLVDLDAGRVALSLSGGLDSTAIAAVAPPAIRAYSWWLPSTPDPVERDNTEAVAERLGLPIRWVDGDADTPLSGDFLSRFVHPSSPYLNPFAALKHRLYAAARADGCRRVMVGDGGDVLYGAANLWLRDALADLQPWAAASLARTVVRAAQGDGFSRSSLLRLVPAWRAARAALRGGPPAWLTREGAALLEPETLSPVLPEGRAARRWDLGVGARTIELESEERRLFHQCGVERANPFWHRPLLETVLRLPAYWFHRDGWDKVLAREALRDRLPAQVLECGRVGSLGPFFLRGIDRNRGLVRELLLERPRSDWQRYVRRGWLEDHLGSTGTLSFGHTILWRTISYELWCRKVWSAGSLP
ncbi:MAG: asparagine synthase-related protein [Thermoanaerobaculales bacterium]|jgi:asparagine synthase (glutamine-hydrolysing)|nr:asparagine synthase-related protein [Thermoanaerobaculales bacterium]